MSIDEYTAEAVTEGPAYRAAKLRDAHTYNRQLFGSASVAANGRLPQADASTAAPDYSEQLLLDDNGTMGRISIPDIDVDLPIYHGTSDDVLDKGVGHLEGTALPVGGTGTHAVLTAHRGLASAELFTRLDEITMGASFTVEVLGEVFAYRVIDTRVVDPSETQMLNPVAGDDLLTLVTCTPLGINSHRILVTAERVLPTPPADAAASGRDASGPVLAWWALIAAGALVVLGAYVGWAGLQEARIRQARSSGAIGGELIAMGSGPARRRHSSNCRRTNGHCGSGVAGRGLGSLLPAERSRDPV